MTYIYIYVIYTVYIYIWYILYDIIYIYIWYIYVSYIYMIYIYILCVCYIVMLVWLRELEFLWSKQNQVPHLPQKSREPKRIPQHDGNTALLTCRCWFPHHILAVSQDLERPNPSKSAKIHRTPMTDHHLSHSNRIKSRLPFLHRTVHHWEAQLLYAVGWIELAWQRLWEGSCHAMSSGPEKVTPRKSKKSKDLIHNFAEDMARGSEDRSQSNTIVFYLFFSLFSFRETDLCGAQFSCHVPLHFLSLDFHETAPDINLRPQTSWGYAAPITHPQTPVVLPCSTFFNSKLQMEHLSCPHRAAECIPNFDAKCTHVCTVYIALSGNRLPQHLMGLQSSYGTFLK